MFQDPNQGQIDSGQSPQAGYGPPQEPYGMPSNPFGAPPHPSHPYSPPPPSNNLPYQQSSVSGLPPAQAVPLPLGEALGQLPRQYIRVLTRPSATTFAQEMGKASWGSVWIQLLGLACFSGLIVALLGLLGLVVGGTTLSPLALSFGVLAVALIASLLVVVLFFLLTGFFYLCAKRAGGQGTFLVPPCCFSCQAA